MFESFFQSFLCTVLMGSSMVIGFFLTSAFLIKVNHEPSIEEDSDDEINPYSFLEELENEPMSNLSESELKELENVNVVLPLNPLLKQTIRMYYDYKEDAFCYYSEHDTIYKYLDIVARYYVIENHCKQIYVELSSSQEKNSIETTQNISGPFVSRKSEKKKVYEKKLIRFIYKGNESDYLKKDISQVLNDINILDFLKMQKKEDRDSDDYENITKED
jgi:hypothetical protein